MKAIVRALLPALCVVALSIASAPAAPKATHGAMPPNASAYGKTLPEWLTAYWTWYHSTGQNITGVPLPPYQPGPAPVVFMPVPVGTQTGGNWLPEDPAILEGSMSVALPSGTAFVMPLFAWNSERYASPDPGLPDDPMIGDAAMRVAVFHPGEGPGSQPEVTIDGKPLLRDFWDYYVGPIYYESPVMYPEPTGYGSIATVAFQGAGMVVPPLPPGRHVMRVLEEFHLTEEQVPGWNVGLVYDNTWIIDVIAPGKRMK